MEQNGKRKIQKQNVLKQLAELEKIQENRSMRPEEIISRTTLISEFEDIAKREEIAWRQRSRAVWLEQGIETQISSTEQQMRTGE